MGNGATMLILLLFWIDLFTFSSGKFNIWINFISTQIFYINWFFDYVWIWISLLCFLIIPIPKHFGFLLTFIFPLTILLLYIVYCLCVYNRLSSMMLLMAFQQFGIAIFSTKRKLVIYNFNNIDKRFII